MACVGNNLGSCNDFDIPCICRSSDLISNLSCCVANECSAEDQQGECAALPPVGYNFLIQVCHSHHQLCRQPLQAGRSGSAHNGGLHNRSFCHFNCFGRFFDVGVRRFDHRRGFIELDGRCRRFFCNRLIRRRRANRRSISPARFRGWRGRRSRCRRSARPAVVIPQGRRRWGCMLWCLPVHRQELASCIWSLLRPSKCHISVFDTFAHVIGASGADAEACCEWL